MSNKKISDLALSGAITASDLLQVVDVEDLSMSPTGTNKKITTQTLGDYLPVTATGSSASRSLRDRFSDTINVKDFGAVGDGVADDTAAIQAALTSASVTDTVLIPNGIFKVTSNLVANCPVVFDGVMSIVSPIVTFKLNAQPIVLDDYRKIYMGINWNEWDVPGGGIALQRAVEQLFGQFRYHTIHGGGRQMRLDFEINISNFSASYGMYKYITDMYIVLQNDGTFGIRNSTTGVITPSTTAYAFDVDAPTTASSIFGIIFDKIRINCRKAGNGILFNFENNQESIIQNTNITNPYNSGIKTIGTHIQINTCRITGGEFSTYDDERIVTGIEIGGSDSEITNTTVQYCKTCVLVKQPSCLISNSHFFNASSDNRAPVLHVTNDHSDLRATGCYFDNGPIWIDNSVGQFIGAGRISFQNCLYTYTKISHGDRSFISVRPNEAGAVFRGILVSGCQFRDYRLFDRERSHVGNGTTTVFDCPLTNVSSTYVDSSCDISSGSNIITLNNTSQLIPGLNVTGSGIPANTIIIDVISGSQIKINTNATTTGTNVTLTFKSNGSTYLDSDCSTVTGSDEITVSGTYKLVPGLNVTGTGIPSNTVITEILSDYKVKLNRLATATGTSANLTFSETLEVKINGTRVYNWTLGVISPGINRTQELTFSSPPASGVTIDLCSKYFAAVPFDVDSTNGSIDPNDAWDIHIKDNAFYDKVTFSTTDIEPVLRQSSEPMLKIETNSTDLEYDVDWNYKTPFRFHVFNIESLGWRFLNTNTGLSAPNITYQRLTARSGKIILSAAREGTVLIKASSAGMNDINLIN